MAILEGIQIRNFRALRDIKTRTQVTGRDKYDWAETIAPHLDLDAPKSPSFGKLIDGIARELQAMGLA